MANARQFMAARTAAWRGKPLPYDAEVEYLESHGTEWIDTGIDTIVNGPYWIRCRFSVPSNAYAITGADGGFVIGVNNGNIFGSSITVVVNRMYDVLCENDGNGRFVSVDGVSTGTLSNYREYNRIIMFGFTQSNGSKRRLYPFRIASNSIYINGLVRDFVAVRFTNERGETEGAMYDRVSGKIFRNQGSGAFVIGPDKT